MSSKEIVETAVETLEVAGVRHCYGIVGGTLNHITDAIYRSQIQWAHVHHEEAVAFAAGAESYISGCLTACAGSRGSGSLHFINDVYEVQRNHAPMALIVSQVVTPQLGAEFPQEVDFKAVYASYLMFCRRAHSPEQARRIVALAYQTAFNQYGVAVVTLPTDIGQATVKDDLPFSVYFPQSVLRPSDAELQDIARLLAHGKEIGICAGSSRQGTHDLLVALTDRLKAPIMRTSRAKDFVEYDNPFGMGVTSMLGAESDFHMMTECDTFLLLSTDLVQVQFYPQKATLIQVGRDGSCLGRRHPVDLGVVGDVIPTLETLLPLLEVREERSFLDRCLEYRERSLWTLEKEEQVDRGELVRPQHLVSLLGRYASEDVLFTADSGSTMIWLLRHIHSNDKRRAFTSLVYGAIADAMPQALGLKKTYPGRQVISIFGSDDLTMLLDDLLTIIQERLSIKVVVLNNASPNFAELEQKVEGLLDNYTDLLDPDFARPAEVTGFHKRKMTCSEDLEVAVQEFLARPGPALLDVHINPVELTMLLEIESGQVVDVTLYAVKAVFNGRFKDVETLLVNNLLK